MAANCILVTGGAGFIGSHTVDYLLSKNYQVIVLDNLSNGNFKNLPQENDQLHCIQGDILDYALLESLLKKCDSVLHLAAIASVQASIEKVVPTAQVNLQGFLHILEAIRNVNPAIRLVYASSASVYGNESNLPCRDDIPLVCPPLSPYALQKKQCEQYASLYAQLYNISSLGLRYFNVYGLRQDASSPYSGVISRFVTAYRHKQPLTIYGSGLQSRDFIAVNDVAQANYAALTSNYTGVMNIASGSPHHLLEIISSLEKVGGYSADIAFAPSRAGDIQASYANIQLAVKHLQFKSNTHLTEGLKELVAV